MTPLYLIYPQWQGSGNPDAPRLYDGAWYIQDKLAQQHNFLGIAVHPEDSSPAKARVNAHATLLTHLNAAKVLLQDHAPEKLVTIGGDCGVDAYPLAYLSAQHGDDMAVLWLDAHADLNTPASSPSGAFHGMVLRTLLGDGDPDMLALLPTTLQTDQVFLAGVRAFDPPELAYAQEQRIKLFSSNDLLGHPEYLIETLQARGFSKLHIHLDLDVLDPTEFNATGFPTPHGVTTNALLTLLTQLESAFTVVGVTLTEFLPHADLTALTGTPALEVLERVLAGLPLVHAGA